MQRILKLVHVLLLRLGLRVDPLLPRYAAIRCTRGWRPRRARHRS